MSKVCLVGCGNVGITYAYELIMKSDFIEDLVLIDIVKDKVEGEILDLTSVMALNSNFINIKSGEYSDCKDADLVVITAGKNQRNANENRISLLKDNSKLVSNIIKEIEETGFKGIYMIATNPVDLISLYSFKENNLSKNRIFGTGTTLDTIRLKCEIGRKLEVNPKSVNAYVLGEHGDSEFVAWSIADIGGVKINSKLSLNEKNEISDNVKNLAYKIIEKKGYTNFGIASVMYVLTKAVLCDENLVYTVSTYDEKEGLFYSMPCIINSQGVKEKIHVEFDNEEKKFLIKTIKKFNETLKKA